MSMYLEIMVCRVKSLREYNLEKRNFFENSFSNLIYLPSDHMSTPLVYLNAIFSYVFSEICKTYFDEAKRISGARYHLVAGKRRRRKGRNMKYSTNEITYQHILSELDVVDHHKYDSTIVLSQNHRF